MKQQRLYGIVSIVLFCSIVIVSGLIYVQLTQNVDSKVIVDENQQTMYKLPEDATAFQVGAFDELELALESEIQDKYLISGLVVKNFIADFYTWANKTGTHDVGGMQYVYGPETLGIYSQAKNLFYRDLSYLIQKYGKENLLEVDSVTIKYVDPEENFLYKDIVFESYYVGAEWTYKSNPGFDTSVYQTKAYFSVLYRDGKLEIYRYYEE